MLPLLVAGIAGLYGTGKAIDNVRYWNDYKKNTGYSPRYPFLRGSYDFMKYGGSSFGKLKQL